MPLAWIALNSVKGLGPVRIRQLLDTFGSPEEVFRERSLRTGTTGVIPEVCAAQLKDPALFDNARQQIEAAEKLGVTILTLVSANYPPYLKEIFAPPPVLYVKGDVSVFKEHAIGIVGTRNPTQYGKNITLAITRELVENNMAIISGLAYGIDTCAHETCVERGGRTVAVLGSGIDRIYPSSNRHLAERIAEKGALVSEFPIGIPPESFNFPRRNRIISGLAAGVLVVEAGERSGSLITANYAVQQGRDVFAVPGPVNSPQSNGTFNLLKEGALPVRNARDIIDAVRQVIAAPQVMNSSRCPVPKLPLELVSEEERMIIERCTDEPVRIDILAETTGKPLADLFNLVLNLELKGLIRQVSGQQYVRA
jgi:DNA processing protein